MYLLNILFLAHHPAVAMWQPSIHSYESYLFIQETVISK